MAIRIQHGDIGDVISLAEEAGQAQQTRRKEAAAQRAHEAALRFASDLQRQKNTIRMAEITVQAKQQAEERRMLFEFEKIDIRAQNTFQMEEMSRARKVEAGDIKEAKRVGEYEALRESIEKNETISPSEKNRFLANAEARFHMGPGAPQIAIERQRPQTMLDMLREQQEEAVKEEPVRLTPEGWRAAGQRGNAIMIEKSTGNIAEIPFDEVKDLEATGDYIVAPSPIKKRGAMDTGRGQGSWGSWVSEKELKEGLAKRKAKRDEGWEEIKKRGIFFF